jgi:hypothetical protein
MATRHRDSHGRLTPGDTLASGSLPGGRIRKTCQAPKIPCDAVGGVMRCYFHLEKRFASYSHAPCRPLCQDSRGQKRRQVATGNRWSPHPRCVVVACFHQVENDWSAQPAMPYATTIPAAVQTRNDIDTAMPLLFVRVAQEQISSLIAFSATALLLINTWC